MLATFLTTSDKEVLSALGCAFCSWLRKVASTASGTDVVREKVKVESFRRKESLPVGPYMSMLMYCSSRFALFLHPCSLGNGNRLLI